MNKDLKLIIHLFLEYSCQFERFMFFRFGQAVFFLIFLLNDFKMIGWKSFLYNVYETPESLLNSQPCLSICRNLMTKRRIFIDFRGSFLPAPFFLLSLHRFIGGCWGGCSLGVASSSEAIFIGELKVEIWELLFSWKLMA